MLATTPLPRPLRRMARAPKVVRDLLAHPINRRQKLAALGRIVRWQIAARVAASEVVHPWVQGTRFLVRRGEVGLTGNVYAGLHEFEEMAFLLHLLRPGDRFADVGANSGSYTLLAAGVAGAHVVAFEPVPEPRGRLETNLRINGIESLVDVVPKGVGEAPGTVSFTVTHDSKNHVSTAEEMQSASTLTVEVTTLDETLGGREPTLIKIDVEGYEPLVLRGAEAVLASPSLLALIVEINQNLERYGFRADELDRNLERFGFHRYAYDPFSRTLHSLAPGDRKERPWSDNVLFVRNTEEVRRRIERADAVDVLGIRL